MSATPSLQERWAEAAHLGDRPGAPSAAGPAGGAWTVRATPLAQSDRATCVRYQPRARAAIAGAPKGGPFWPSVVLGGCVVLTVIALIAGLTGRSAPAKTLARQTRPTTAATGDLDLAGAGAQTTLPFTATTPFTFAYSVSCTSAVGTTALFLLQSTTGPAIGVVDPVDNGIGASARRRGIPAGTYRVHVQAPPTCSWTVRSTP